MIPRPMPGRRPIAVGLALGAVFAAVAAGQAGADIVHADDVIIEGSLCVGSDCVDNEVFAGEVFWLKSNNPGVRFTDTSSSSGFATRDWQILTNEPGSGGDEMFSVRDVDGAATPFTIEGGANQHTLFVAQDTRIGIGTGFPATILHMESGDTPTIRMRQNATQGYTAQTWELGSNDSNLFIRDQGGNTLPFRVRPGAPTSSVDISTNGDVGIGTPVPNAPLHVSRADGTARVIVQDISATQGVRELFLMENKGGSYFTLKNTASGRSWFFNHENAAAGRFIITSSTNPSQGLFLSPDGNLQIGGALTQNSDRESKVAIEPVDAGAILDKLAALPISAWTYRTDAEAGTRHIGPMAQDFHAAFGTGASATGISTLDTSGVALAAIQALRAETEAQRALIGVLVDRIDEMEARLAR